MRIDVPCSSCHGMSSRTAKSWWSRAKFAKTCTARRCTFLPCMMKDELPTSESGSRRTTQSSSPTIRLTIAIYRVESGRDGGDLKLRVLSDDLLFSSRITSTAAALDASFKLASSVYHLLD